MSSTLIGALLDEARDWAYALRPAPVFVTLPGSQSGEPTRLQPRSVARALLAERLRQCLDPKALIEFEEGTPFPDYDHLLAWCREPQYPLEPDADLAARSPDIVMEYNRAGSIGVIEVGYGFEPEVAKAALDRLLMLNWMTQFPCGRRPVDFLAYIFIHERDSSEITYEVEQAYIDWVKAHYGPFNGQDRIYLPMMPRFSRSSLIGPRDGTVISAIDLESRPCGFMACCISYERHGA